MTENDMPDWAENTGIEEVDVGDLSDVKDTPPLIPPTKNVKLIIKRISPRQSEDAKWRWINLGLQLVDGIGEEGKYKNMYVNSKNIAYYADKEQYPNGFRQGPLAELQRATNTIGSKINNDWIDAIRDTIILAEIKQEEDKYRGEIVNVARYFKPVPEDQLV